MGKGLLISTSKGGGGVIHTTIPSSHAMSAAAAAAAAASTASHATPTLHATPTPQMIKVTTPVREEQVVPSKVSVNVGSLVDPDFTGTLTDDVVCWHPDRRCGLLAP